jgi:hypothetical protein
MDKNAGELKKIVPINIGSKPLAGYVLEIGYGNHIVEIRESSVNHDR